MKWATVSYTTEQFGVSVYSEEVLVDSNASSNTNNVNCCPVTCAIARICIQTFTVFSFVFTYDKVSVSVFVILPSIYAKFLNSVADHVFDVPKPVWLLDPQKRV